MTMIYVPTLIESVEQAEELPVGTVAFVTKPVETMPVGALTQTHRGMAEIPAVKILADRWYIAGALARCRDAEIVGGRALVPVEAEEETDVDCVDVPGGRPIHRYVTPWTDAP